MLHYLKIFIFASFVILVCLSKTALAEGRKTIRIQNYEFVYSKPDSIFTKTLVSRVGGSLKKIEDFFGYQPASIITVYITRSETEYSTYAMAGVPEWSQAVAFPEKKIIVLKIVNPEDMARSPEIVLHEIVHIFLGERYPGNIIPVWLNEGIAQYLSGSKITLDDKLLLANAFAAGNLSGLEALDSLTAFNPVKARLAYLEAFTAVEFIVKEYGESTLQLLLKNFTTGRSANRAFKLTFGFDFIDFEFYWYQALDDDYRWLVMLNLENLIFIAIGFLALMAIVIKRYKNKKMLSKWEQDEAQLN